VSGRGPRTTLRRSVRGARRQRRAGVRLRDMRAGVRLRCAACLPESGVVALRDVCTRGLVRPGSSVAAAGAGRMLRGPERGPRPAEREIRLKV